jgi:hypothetical protein
MPNNDSQSLADAAFTFASYTKTAINDYDVFKEVGSPFTQWNFERDLPNLQVLAERLMDLAFDEMRRKREMTPFQRFLARFTER